MAPELDAEQEPWRPVQFLGNKLRSLAPISAAVSSLSDSSQRIWEPFSGSSVVSQRLAADGHQVWSCDALLSSSVFAASTLGVNRPNSEASLRVMAGKVIDYAQDDDPDLWHEVLAAERKALAYQDGARLLEIEAKFPQRWRTAGASPELQDHFELISSLAEEARECGPGLISTTYAGTYFSLEQSIHLERLREGIRLATAQQPSSWEFTAMITALAHAASRAVFSPGKHFAQPHRIRADKSLGFHAKRALQDRSINVLEAFADGVRRVTEAARFESDQHRAEQRLCGSVTVGELREWQVDTVYADPPYTAQQYSRFYHLLETLTCGIPPRLQLRSGTVTRGLYPQGRYLSPFSSRRQAPKAFRSLISTTHEAGAHMLLSYSDGLGSTVGNARMVTLDKLIDWMGDVYGPARVTVERLNFKYRQFNNGQQAISERNDPEFLVTGRNSAR